MLKGVTKGNDRLSEFVENEALWFLFKCTKIRGQFIVFLFLFLSQMGLQEVMKAESLITLFLVLFEVK